MLITYTFFLCLCSPSAGGAAESSSEGEERPAVQDGGGPGGPQRADEETQGCHLPGLFHSLPKSCFFQKINASHFSCSTVTKKKMFKKNRKILNFLDSRLILMLKHPALTLIEQHVSAWVVLSSPVTNCTERFKRVSELDTLPFHWLSGTFRHY